MSKILLIEDDPLIFRLYQKLFSLEGFESELAENGKSGIEKLKSFHPDIILLDIMMPDMNGIEMMSQLKEMPESKDIPIVVLTNIADMNVTNIALQKGAVLVIIKSQTEPAEVVASIKGVLARPDQQNDNTDSQAEEK
jgi:CheY-like chemotaxis protein